MSRQSRNQRIKIWNQRRTGCVGNPQPPSVTEEELVDRVRGIYTELVKVEKNCIEITREQMSSRAELSKTQWQRLVEMHRTLLYQHHDFFSLTAQHPAASPVLGYLPDKYSMPARMWDHAIRSFLELLHQKLPSSWEHMLDFIHFSYSMMTLMLESVPDFRETWIERLGDLARYRMAIEAIDQKDRDLWAGVSKYWYSQNVASILENGRIQHHLAILSRPDVLQQFFHYTKALINVRPFADSRDRMVQLVTRIMSPPAQRLSLIPSFVNAHGLLILETPSGDFASRAKAFLSSLRRDVGLLDRPGEQSAQMTCCNISAIFQYGHTAGAMQDKFDSRKRSTTAEYRTSVAQWTSHPGQSSRKSSDRSTQLTFQASSLAFHTLIVMLDQVDNQHMYPSVHISMAFVWCLTLNPGAIQWLEPLVPWVRLAAYLNGFINLKATIPKFEAENFPLCEDPPTKQLPEDLLIRGQAWTQLYYPENFFEAAPSEDDRLPIVHPATLIPRIQRCLWLGVRIAKVSCPPFYSFRRTDRCLQFARWITYDQTQGFRPTRLAEEYAPCAESTASLTGDI
ncbi:uncharacterized protein N7506_005632 [Penicillium brevicompactum]|uniref:uncharacterized protein n=1 Tax=Penicillium brevicompactum TaxID=5074 RepID=UPI002540D30A|nr:uncharacterized protein N7506_005632 [Penicillium brevicompactum]KAJ5335696.1 hypothetical protein N7506_005632 [Penicillium brevicompactum]